MPELMNTREVAAYLRIKERKVYDLVAARSIPCTRATGKWLFPKPLIDLWLLRSTEYQAAFETVLIPPPVIAGSHDPLLEWAVREADCGLALLIGGSLAGLEQLASRQALACGLHVFEPSQGGHNIDLVRHSLAEFPVVALEWAWREQGLIVAAGNPLAIGGLQDLIARRARFVDRQPGAGSHLLLEHLLAVHGLNLADLAIELPAARSETEVAQTVFAGKADAGLGIAAVARQFRLDFVPLHRERYDLVIGRRDYFEPAFQRLLAFARTPRFASQAADLQGYDISGLGQVVYNAP
ncbi:MAG: helix-turn-helix transcriptional regulator [Gammaproteobacteria bacterium]|nr:helix-turn-helix transcriptional regulator [Gammaproteobacteria bacterium]MCP5423670.1 helix-turn-helix transcriptional regulator [Gammaproteobacteria bacterium]